ncbi:DUF1573 domain-containing protein [Christiangramia sp. SM2212]|uniref:DUF1573 domain-containing protein n=1 Tax=Christiangramia sediminicola TaxID=3073267 RepID=A0ABU1ESM4_9FLAO|nr:DUF1573 domain-containing protein [Christiangramia sp. SM2212]MDR5590964.1 DUF1573 domain-containing protein [Christiangramia sp. SM2212]
MKKTILMFAAVGAMLFTGCKDNASDKVKAENVEASAERDAKETVYPEITFEETEFDFGNIAKGTPVEHVFKFTNTGDAPLVITNASSSCGCTVPTYPKNETIAPGDSGEMLVKFNGAGNGQVTKTVTVSANTEAGKEQIKIKAFVEADENAS